MKYFFFIFLFQGVVAKADIKRNTLLVASKATSIVYSIECVKNKVITLDDLTKQRKECYQSQNVAETYYKVQNNPHLAKNMYKLYAGANFDRNQSVDDFVVDTARLEAILNLNSFTSGYDDYRLDDGRNNHHDEDKLEGENQGIWVFPAYFNHSCLPNTKTEFFSDFMKIYSSNNSIFYFNLRVLLTAFNSQL
jgi:hypothetical protein